MTTSLIDDDDQVDEVRPPRDRRLNPYRVPVSDCARTLVTEITSAVDAQLPPRKRKRRPADQATFERTVSALVCDLAVYSLIETGEGVSVRRSNIWPPARYRTPADNKMIAPVLDALTVDGLGYFIENKGQQGFEAGQSWLTSLQPSQKFRDLIKSHGVELEDFGQDHTGEVIHLAGPKSDHGKADLLPYEDTVETHRLRAEIVKINAWLAQADLSMDEFHFGEDDHFPDLTQRTLIRRFTQGGFESGGRLWNGFWQKVKKVRRRDALTIDGEDAVELDYGQAGPRILYGIAGVPVPEGDLYAIPGFHGYRDGVKRGVAAMMAADRRLVRTPKEIKARFGPGHTMAKFVAAVEAHHRPVAPLFFTGIGHRIQRIESDILVSTLLALIDRGITALPIHDAVMVPRSAASTARDIMIEAFRAGAGVEGAVSSHPLDLFSSS